ncbi:unnamed protein product [Bemisia tabaci]|uniref:Ionotropic receptor n=1 Tax=Bemisia tabaci TaxID=7038 RepID=A0A9P0A2B6_BEMTA|nr:unnamed protein product [Bemisia tabaci]
MFKFPNFIFVLTTLRVIGAYDFVDVNNISVSDDSEPLTSLPFHMCQTIVRKTELQLFYIVDIHSHLVSSHLIESLHTNSIQTILISHHSKVRSSVITDGPKNMIFILQDFQELFNLIFFTISQADLTEINKEIVTGLGNNKSHPRCRLKETLPRYCIKVDGRYLWSRNRKACKKVIITSSELEDMSVLSDGVFNATRGLYFNKIWNSRNHLIIMLQNVQRNTTVITVPKEFPDGTLTGDVTGSLIFCFKFFWRFFKGRNTVISHPGSCEKYDAFTGNLISYQNDTHETFFDFSWENLNGKTFGVSNFIHSAGDMRVLSRPGWSNIVGFYMDVLDYFELSANCTFRFILPKDETMIEDSLRSGIDILAPNTGIVSKETDHSKFDFSVSIHASSLCIATPHSAFMSQGLVIFKSFPLPVWVLTCVTIIVFFFIQYSYQYSQCESFQLLYTDAEIDYYRNTSSLLTVYAYFMCGSPPSLHLGRLITGKILFGIFSFATIILSTVFLSGMTTLLSDRVMYPEIDSLETLAMSDHCIQSPVVIDTDMSIFIDELNQSETMRGKFVDSMEFYNNFVNDLMTISFSKATNASNYHDLLWIFEPKHGEIIKEIQRNIRLIAEKDAFLRSVPFFSTPKTILRMKFLSSDDGEIFEYHLMKECLMSYPLMFLFPKNWFFFDKINQLIAQFFESGHAGKILMKYMIAEAEIFEIGSRSPNTEDEPRAYDLNDLQSAFIALAIGLFLSFLTFLGEILTDMFQHTAAVKYLRKWKNSLASTACKILQWAKLRYLRQN